MNCPCKKKLVYIAGYRMKNYVVHYDEATYDYYHKYVDYLKENNRGGLQRADDIIWVISYFFF